MKYEEKRQISYVAHCTSTFFKRRVYFHLIGCHKLRISWHEKHCMLFVRRSGHKLFKGFLFLSFQGTSHTTCIVFSYYLWAFIKNAPVQPLLCSMFICEIFFSSCSDMGSCNFLVETQRRIFTVQFKHCKHIFPNRKPAVAYHCNKIHLKNSFLWTEDWKTSIFMWKLTIGLVYLVIWIQFMTFFLQPNNIQLNNFALVLLPTNFVKLFSMAFFDLSAICNHTIAQNEIWVYVQRKNKTTNNFHFYELVSKWTTTTIYVTNKSDYGVEFRLCFTIMSKSIPLLASSERK